MNIQNVSFSRLYDRLQSVVDGRTDRGLPAAELLISLGCPATAAAAAASSSCRDHVTSTTSPLCSRSSAAHDGGGESRDCDVSRPFIGGGVVGVTADWPALAPRDMAAWRSQRHAAPHHVVTRPTSTHARGRRHQRAVQSPVRAQPTTHQQISITASCSANIAGSNKTAKVLGELIAFLGVQFW